MKIRLLLLFLFFWNGLGAQYYFDKISSAQGLSQSSVQCIFQDSEGFLWFGTQDGLNRYDGYGFKIFRHKNEDPTSISSSEISFIFEDSKKRLWIGLSQGGLNLFNKANQTFQHFSLTEKGEPMHQLQVQGFAEDSKGKILVAASEGLFEIDALLKVRRINSFPQGFVLSSIFCDQNQNIWIGTSDGTIWKLKKDQQQFQRYKIEKKSNSPSHQRVHFILEDKAGEIIAGTEGSGLFQFDRQLNKFRSTLYFQNEFEGRNLLRAGVNDREGRIWLGTDAGLLSVRPSGDHHELLQFIAPNPSAKGGLSSHAIQSMYYDRFGNLWVGMWEADLNVLYSKSNQFLHLSMEDGLLANKVTGVALVEKAIWVGTGKGITCFPADGSESRQVMIGKDITSIAARGNTMLVSVWNEGFFLNHAPSRGGTQLLRPFFAESAVKIRVGSASVGTKRLWIGDSEGKIRVVDFESNKLLSLPKGDIGNFITAIVEDQDADKVWIGTYGRGLFTYSIKHSLWQEYPLRNVGEGSSNVHHINTLYRDSKKRIWIGTRGGGLFVFSHKTKTFKRYSTHDGLPNDVIHSILEDDRGRFWIATNEGICRFNPAKNTFRTFNEHDGLKGKEFISHSAFKAADGRLFFGGMHGLNYFHPDSVSDDLKLPQVHLNQLLLLNKPVNADQARSPLTKNINETRKFRLPYARAAAITFEYVGLYFQKNNECTYSFKLEGFDPEWNRVGKQRTATYTNLNPGTYTFMVKAANSDGVWNEVAKTIQFTIAPPWYLSWWAYCLYLMILMAALVVYRNYVRNREALKSQLRLKEIEADNIRELDQLKTNFFTNISHEFRTPLTLILDPVEQLINHPELQPQKVREHYSIIRLNTQRLSRLINQLLDLSKIEAEKYQLHIEFQELIALLFRIVHSFDYQAERQEVKLSLQTNMEEVYAWFDPDAIDKILYNLISNALKASSKGGEITVNAQVLHKNKNDDPQQCILTVKDTGVGIPDDQLPHLFQRFFQANIRRFGSQAGTGVGLALVSELVQIHNGHIKVESQKNVGTTFTVTLPVFAKAFPSAWISGQHNVQDAQVFKKHEPVHLPEEPRILRNDKKIILIAEDNPEMLAYLADNLENHFMVIRSENGQEALDQSIRYIPDLIISDLLMPKMDGMVFCKAIKESEKTSHIPFILLTSRSVVESQLEGFRMGADDYLTKPFNFDLLLARVQNLLEQRRLLRERFAKMPLNGFTTAEIEITSTDEQFLKKTIQAIEANISNFNFTVEQLEEALNMSKMQLYRKLMFLTNMGGNAFIRHVRLHRAAQLLDKSNLTVAEIAYQVGFNSPSYFTKAYKKEFGRLPSAISEKE